MKNNLLKSLLIAITLLVGCSNSVKSQTISAGGEFSLSLCSDGTVNAWGKNNEGQLGDTSSTNSNIPITVSGLNGVTLFSAGGIHSLAIKNNGTVWGWGSNSDGQLGIGGSIMNSYSPTMIFAADITKISAGSYHSLFLKSDGTVWSCGYGSNGELGSGTSVVNNFWPEKIGLGNAFTNVIAISAGGSHSLMLKNDGTVWGCGYNGDGELGLGGSTNTNKFYPLQMLGISGVIAIAAGGKHSLMLKNDGTVWSCGYNYDGELGNGNNLNNNIAAPIIGLSGITAIAAGIYHSLALKNDGTVYIWGSNAGGQIGIGNNINSNIPVQINAISGAIGIEAGGGHSLIQKNDGTVWGSGFNYQGQLGLGNDINSNMFQQTTNLCNALSTQDNLIETLISIYPNPVKDILTIQNPKNHPIDKITITDVTGKKVLEQKSISNTVNVEQLQNGMYLLSITSDGKNSVTKFIKN